MGKPPAFQFYPGDWSRDLEEHPLEIEGAWIRICCKLWWAENRGELTRTPEQWAKILRVDITTSNRIIDYIKEWKIGDVFMTPNGSITVISRRIMRDEKERENNRVRQRRFAKKPIPNGSITPTSQRSSSSSSSSKIPPISPGGGNDAFDAFWKEYPKKVGKGAARKAWVKAKDKPDLPTLLNALSDQKKSNQWKKDNGQYIPNPATWLNQARWGDELEAVCKPNW